MKTDRLLLVSLGAIALAAWTFVGSTFYRAENKALNQTRESEAIAYCLNNGGLARFDYYTGSDRFALVGCTFSRQQERP